MRKSAWMVPFALALLLAACNQQAANQPSYTENDFDQAWSGVKTDLKTSFNDLATDPALQAIFQMPSDAQPLALAALNAMNPLNALKPEGLVPLSTHELPSGGTDYTKNPPENYTPANPYDFGVKWLADTHTAELLVNWDAGKNTVYAHDPNGESYELPQAAHADLTVDDNAAGSADFDATWHACNGGYITEPDTLSFTGELGANKKLNWNLSYSLTEGSSDRLHLGLELATVNTDPEARITADLTLYGTVTRGTDCFIESGRFNRGSLTYTTQVGNERVEFRVNVTDVESDQNGHVSRVDLNGYVRHNGQTAVTFSGYIDDADTADGCPGEHVTLTFKDGSTTLEDWLKAEGYCSP